MSWNYRIFKEDEEFSIREVYYHEDKPIMYTEDAMAPTGETIVELARDIGMMQLALDKTILTPKDFKK